MPHTSQRGHSIIHTHWQTERETYKEAYKLDSITHRLDAWHSHLVYAHIPLCGCALSPANTSVDSSIATIGMSADAAAAIPSRCKCRWSSTCDKACKCHLAGQKCSELCHPVNSKFLRRIACKNTPWKKAPQPDDENEKNEAEGASSAGTDDSCDGAAEDDSLDIAPVEPARKKQKVSASIASAVVAAASSDQADEAEDAAIFFKSTSMNGFAFLSNFWPNVENKVKAAVRERLATIIARETGNSATEAAAAAASSPPAAASPTPDSSSSSSSDLDRAFLVDGVSYRTVEHYYHAMKFAPHQPDIAERIRNAPTGLQAKKLNTQYKMKYPAPKELLTSEHLIDVMYRGVHAKFSQSVDLRALLLSTGTRTLHETRGRIRDIWTFQPDDPDQTADQLGKVLMRVREELRKTQPMK